MSAKIRIDRLALEGDGVGRSIEPPSDKVAFVPYSLPGETVQARVLTQKKNFVRWLPEAVLTSSPSRIDPPCPQHFRPGAKTLWCGGCDWQHLALSTQRESKRQLVVESLERIGGLTHPTVGAMISGPQEWRYRNKVQVPFRRQINRLVAGFYTPASHDVVEFEDCLVQPEISVRVVQAVKRYATRFKWSVYDEDSHKGWLRHLLIRTNEKGEALVTLVTAQPFFRDKKQFIEMLRSDCPFVIGLFQNVQRARTNVILGRDWIHLGGQTHLEEDLCGLRLKYSAASFFQVNSKAAERLYSLAVEELKATPDGVLLDLYCGVGAMTLLGARRVQMAVGVEESPFSIHDAKENARLNNCRNVEFIQSDVESFVQSKALSWLPKRSAGDLFVIIDPPRSGCERPVLEGLMRLKPKRVVYVSCHPATLARDLKILSRHYRLVRATPVDLFPQTSHIEVVALLE